MSKKVTVGVLILLLVIVLLVLMPEIAHAQFTGGFETKMQSLTTRLITVILPLISVLGLVYAAILAVAGDGAAKGRIITVIVCSVIGFLAPHIISWFQSAAGY